MKLLQKIFIIVCLLVMIVPFAGMSFWMSNTTSENTPLAPWPALMENGSLNTKFLLQAGEFFEDHFAFRQDLITLNSKLQTSLFHTSPVEKVIYGNNGWLYFNGTLDDYQGKNLLNQRSIHNIAHNLGLMQFYCQSKGSQFALMIAPNKNSLYPENMPNNYIPGDLKNIDYLQEALQKENITYIDLFDLFENKEETLYFEKDTHWNSKGALQAYYQLMNQMGLAHTNYEDSSANEIEHISDLDEMLFPKSVKTEKDYDYSDSFDFTVLNEIEDYMTDYIETANPNGSGSLLMFRDSFGEAILPFMANDFQHGVFSRLTPYNLLQMESLHPTLVIIEKAERNIKDLQENAAIMEMPTISNLQYEAKSSNSSIELKKDGSYYRINGTADENLLTDETQLYLEVEQPDSSKKTYTLFYTAGDEQKGNGFDVYLNQNKIPSGSTIRLIAYDSAKIYSIAEKSI